MPRSTRRTGKETTHLHARFLDEHTEEVFELLAEMLLAPTYPEIDSERDVVLEEIAMYEDEPQDRVHDILADAVFGAHPLGRRVLGEAEVIARSPCRRSRPTTVPATPARTSSSVRLAISSTSGIAALAQACVRAPRAGCNGSARRRVASLPAFVL